MKLVFAGTPEVAVPALDALIASGRHEVAAVVTRPDAPAGRGRRLVASPVAERAEEAGIEVLKPVKPRDEDFLARLREIGPDACPVVAYGALLPRVALDVPAHGWVNLHFSLLPAWRGAAPVQHAIMAGDEITGASTFLIEEGLDSGPVYGTVTEEVRRTDTSGDLLTRLAFAGAGLLVATMDGIEDGTLKAVPQPADGITLAPKITVENAHVDWSAPALRVDRMVRGCTPAPGAWTAFRGERLKLIHATPVPERTDLAPGELSVGKNNVYVGTGSYAVELLWVQAQGKKPMRAADWARGVRIGDGPHLPRGARAIGLPAGREGSEGVGAQQRPGLRADLAVHREGDPVVLAGQSLEVRGRRLGLGAEDPVDGAGAEARQVEQALCFDARGRHPGARRPHGGPRVVGGVCPVAGRRSREVVQLPWQHRS
jgi:methionyl-tRNA formyltransferase